MGKKDKNRAVPKVKIAQWRKGLSEGYDVCDDRKNDFREVDSAIVNAKEFKLQIPKKVGVFKVMTGSEANITVPKPTEWIIEKVFPKGFNTILAGTTGSKKSYYAMQMAMSIVNNEKHFTGWKINQKGFKVLYVDTEVGIDEMLRRYKRIKQNMDWQGDKRFNWISKQGIYADIWYDLHNAIELFYPDIVIIDSLYNTTTIGDFSKGHYISQVTDQLTFLKQKFNVSLFVVHHFNKGQEDKGLILDRMSGAAALQNWLEYAILMCKTNEPNFNLWRVGKTRGVPYHDQHYGLYWNDNLGDKKKFWFDMKGVVDNWIPLLTNDYKKKRWIEALERMPDLFETKNWLNVVHCEMNLSERTAKSWLSELRQCEMIEWISHGLYKKKLKIVDELIHE